MKWLILLLSFSANAALPIKILNLSPLEIDRPCAGFTITKVNGQYKIWCGSKLFLTNVCTPATISSTSTKYTIYCNGTASLIIRK